MLAIRTAFHRNVSCRSLRTFQTAGLGMAKPYLSHEERTAAEPRDDGLHAARLVSVKEVNPTVKTIDLECTSIERPFKFLPGQWLDVFVPGISKAGGFTITSAPKDAEVHKHHGELKSSRFSLAIQQSPSNLPAAWLWKSPDSITGQVVNVRIGGSFTWPPPALDPSQYQRVVLVAGGVGINPFASYLNHFRETSQWPEKVSLLYGSKYYEEILFDRTFQTIATSNPKVFDYKLFVTAHPPSGWVDERQKYAVTRRLTPKDVEAALGPSEVRGSSTVFVCGPQAMTDEFVEAISSLPGMAKERVLCEKWW